MTKGGIFSANISTRLPSTIRTHIELLVGMVCVFLAAKQALHFIISQIHLLTH